MDLKAQIQRDFIEAYKAKDALKVSVLRMLKSSLKYAEISEKQALNTEGIIKVLKKEVKQRMDSSIEYEKASRIDLSEKEKSEIIILRNYLPKELSDEETLSNVKESILESDAKEVKDMGKVIAMVMQKTKGAADGSKVAAMVRAELSK